MDCTRKVTPDDANHLQDIINELPPDAVLCLGEGSYDVHLMIQQPLTLRGQGAVLLDGHFRAPVLWVTRKNANLTVENVTLKRGSGGALGAGGNLSVDKAATVVLRNVLLLQGEADNNGGGAVQAKDGEVLLEHCHLLGNRGKKSQVVHAEGAAVITLRDCVVAGGEGPGPAVLVDGGARVIADHSVIAGNVQVASKATDGRIAFDAQGSILESLTLASGKARVAGSALTKALQGIDDGGGNLIQAFAIDANGAVTPAISGRGPRK
jgi:hypothetical protein